jgi:hypothetical protein
MKKAMLLTYILLFLAVCWAPLLAIAFGVKSPNQEKRILAEKPALFTPHGLNLNFPKQFNAYFSDHFGLRSICVTAYTALIYYTLNDSVNEQVIAGKNGWLFFGPTLKDYTAINTLTDLQIDRIVKTLVQQEAYLSSLGITFLFTIAPNKSSVYPEHMPARYCPQLLQNNLHKLSRALEEEAIHYVDLLEPLRAAKREHQVYHAKDTHWNNIGARVAAQTLLNKMQEIRPDIALGDPAPARYQLEQTWLGDLSQILLPALAIEDEQAIYDIPENYTWKENDRRPRSQHNPEAMRIHTTSKTNSTSLYIFRDSFANALIPFISSRCAKVYYTRVVPYDYTQIESISPDVVILEIAERNIPNLLKQPPVMPVSTP